MTPPQQEVGEKCGPGMPENHTQFAFAKTRFPKQKAGSTDPAFLWFWWVV